ncbi:condensation domain-containing protein [Mycobacteroides abscessus]
MLESEDRALPLSRGQLDIWLSQETGLVGAEWQLGLLVRIEGQVERVLLERAIRQAVTDVQPARAAFFEVDGQIVQRPIDHSDLELAFEDLRDSDDPAGLARKKATDIQRTLMPLTGQLLKFALYRTADDEFHLFGLCHHINLDGLGMAVVSRRVASIYTALATGEPIPPAYFGTLQDLVDWETDYVARPPNTPRIGSTGATTSLRTAGSTTGCPTLPKNRTATSRPIPFRWTTSRSVRSRN